MYRRPLTFFLRRHPTRAARKTFNPSFGALLTRLLGEASRKNKKKLQQNKALSKPKMDLISDNNITPAASSPKKANVCYSQVNEENKENIKNESQIHPEHQYLDAIRQIMARGVERENRTGINTKAIFGMQMRYCLRESFPLLTTKRVFWKGILEELLWFIQGSTNGHKLSEKGVRIWDANGSKEFLEKRGIHDREEGDLGPIYGFQWRHFGAEYTNMHDDYSGKGVDQLQDVIRKIKTTPNDRTIIMCAWNAKDLSKMALPPCHCLVQFFVANGELSCQLYQRSADMGLGVPFNIASYALLTYMIAHVTNKTPGDFVHTLGDAHVYVNHEEALQTQLSRQPKSFPKLRIKRKVENIEDFTADDFEILDYHPHPKIKMDMAV